MDLSPEQASQFARDGQEAHHNMAGLLDLTNGMKNLIAATALRSFTETAKVDHLAFKFEVYRVLMGLSAKTAADFASHKVCRLGKWYYEGDGRDCFSRLPGYRELEAPHIQVHQHGQAAVHHFREGRLEEGIAELKAMETASFRVIEQLDRMARHDLEGDSALLCHHLANGAPASP